MGRLADKVTIVTGAGSGIGEATARLMAREGASVVVADINRTEAERVAGELAGAVAVEVDVSDEPSVVRTVETAIESFGVWGALTRFPLQNRGSRAIDSSHRDTSVNGPALR